MNSKTITLPALFEKLIEKQNEAVGTFSEHYNSLRPCYAQLAAKLQGHNRALREQFQKFDLDEIDSDGIFCLSRNVIEIIQEHAYCDTEFSREHRVLIDNESLAEALILDAM